MHEKHEVIDFINEYISGKEIFINLESSIDDDFLKKIIYGVSYIPNMRPDGFSIVDKDIYPIEHFQFDASMEEKGSQLSKKISDLDKKVKNLKKTTTSEINTVSDKMQYINNLINHFVSHAKKVEIYKKNIRNEFKDKNISDVIFFIEDKTIFGAVYINQKPFEIVLTKEFIEIWKNYPEIKYIFVAGNCRGIKYCIVYSNFIVDKDYDSINNKQIIVMNSAQIIDVMEEIKWKR